MVSKQTPAIGSRPGYFLIRACMAAATILLFILSCVAIGDFLRSKYAWSLPVVLVYSMIFSAWAAIPSNSEPTPVRELEIYKMMTVVVSAICSVLILVAVSEDLGPLGHIAIIAAIIHAEFPKSLLQWLILVVLAIPIYFNWVTINNAINRQGDT